MAALLCFLSLTTAFAQESPSPASSSTPTATPAPAKNLAVRFALPPLDGTISLGIYDRDGKLVRTLHREATISDFTAGQDSLETSWDGADDDGKPLPAGKYRGRGFVVGNSVKVEGVGYFFNDWVSEGNSPHVQSLGQLWMENGRLLVGAELAGGKQTTLVCDQSSGTLKGELPPRNGAHCGQVPALPNLVAPIDCAPGRNETTWFVDSLGGAGSAEVKQISKEGQLLRHLTYDANDPQPQKIEASPNDEKIFVIERNNHVQQLRALALVRTTTEKIGEAVSDWQPVFEKKIIAHRDFALENGKPVLASGSIQKPLDTVTQKLRPDPLRHDQPGRLELGVGIDDEGSFIRTKDGLPLRTISDTHFLNRAMISRPNDSSLDVFQDDGAVVEQFRVSGLTEMIAFDCGEFELK
jgi:hypothetical protein